MAEIVETDALNNAGEIIERFGGIRPMASKMAVPVTTVQGWKKRDVIPGNRRGEVLRAAEINAIDLSDIDSLRAGAANGNTASSPRYVRYDDNIKERGDRHVIDADMVDDGNDETESALEDEDEEAFAAGTASSATDQSPATFAAALHDSKAQQKSFEDSVYPRRAAAQEDDMVSVSPSRIIGQSVAMSVVLIAATVAVCGLYGAMKFNDLNHSMTVVATRVDALDKRMAMLENHPVDTDAGDVQQKLGGLEDQITTLSARVQAQVATPAATVPTPTAAAVDADISTLTARIATLEGNVAQLTSVNGLTILSDWLRQLQRSPDGQQILTAAARDLNAHASDDAAAMLNDAQIQGTLGEILNNLNPATRKSGLLLVALADLSNARLRGAPFDEDIQLLQHLLGDAVPQDLKTDLAQLADASKQGVPTQAELQDQLKGLEPAIDQASAASGTYRDRALAKLGALVQVSKDGQRVTGSNAQAIQSRAEALLDKGDIMGAAEQMKKLTGPAGDKAKPFIEASETTLKADRALAQLSAIAAGAVGVGATVHPAAVPQTAAAEPAAKK